MFKEDVSFLSVKTMYTKNRNQYLTYKIGSQHIKEVIWDHFFMTFVYLELVYHYWF